MFLKERRNQRDSPYRAVELAELIGADWLPGSCAHRAVKQAEGSACKPSLPEPGAPDFDTHLPTTERNREQQMNS